MNSQGPTFAPEWYRASNGGGSGGGSGSNHNTGTSDERGGGRNLRSQSLGSSCSSESGSSSSARSSYCADERGSGCSLRDRSSGRSCNNESTQSLSSSNRGSSSFRWSSYGSRVRDTDSSMHALAYSSFGRSHRDRDRLKDVGLRDRDRSSLFLDNDLPDSFESLVGSRNERDTLRRPFSMIPGKRGESWPKRPVNGSNNGSAYAESLIGGNSKVSSFERDFPSLGNEVKQGHPETVRVPSIVRNNAAQSFPVATLVKLGANSRTPLPVVNSTVGSSGPVISSAVQSATNSVLHAASSTTTGLNMAETLAQAPSTESQIQIDTETLNELALRRCAKLRPCTPPVPKSAAEKSKPRGARGGGLVDPPRVGQQPQRSSQRTNNAQPAPPKSDAPKSSSGNLQILSRLKNGITPTAKDSQTSTNASRAENPLGVSVPSGVNTSLNIPIKTQLKADSKGSMLPSDLNSFGEKGRENPFSATLEKETSESTVGTDSSEESGNGEMGICESGEALLNPEKETSASTVSICSSQESGNDEKGGCKSSEVLKNREKETCASTVSEESGKSCESGELPDNQEKEVFSSTSSIDSSKESVNDEMGRCESGEVPENFVSDNGKRSFDSKFYLDPVEEEAFLHRLGWNENAADEPITQEEITGFAEKCKQLKYTSNERKCDARVAAAEPTH